MRNTKTKINHRQKQRKHHKQASKGTCGIEMDYYIYTLLKWLDRRKGR